MQRYEIWGLKCGIEMRSTRHDTRSRNLFAKLLKLKHVS
jgi:hypothetical protein